MIIFVISFILWANNAFGENIYQQYDECSNWDNSWFTRDGYCNEWIESENIKDQKIEMNEINIYNVGPCTSINKKKVYPDYCYVAWIFFTEMYEEWQESKKEFDDRTTAFDFNEKTCWEVSIDSYQYYFCLNPSWSSSELYRSVKKDTSFKWEFCRLVYPGSFYTEAYYYKCLSHWYLLDEDETEAKQSAIDYAKTLKEREEINKKEAISNHEKLEQKTDSPTSQIPIQTNLNDQKTLTTSINATSIQTNSNNQLQNSYVDPNIQKGISKWKWLALKLSWTEIWSRLKYIFSYTIDKPIDIIYSSDTNTAKIIKSSYSRKQYKTLLFNIMKSYVENYKS